MLVTRPSEQPFIRLEPYRLIGEGMNQRVLLVMDDSVGMNLSEWKCAYLRNIFHFFRGL